ncbi:MAG TPA: hypothetical protein VNO30_09095 [Kofleriaceae bacterium]|nr:hypothetical protein [Kofleriaceae bacterium]
MPSVKRQVPFGAIALALYMLSLVLPAIVAINEPLIWGSPHDEIMTGIQCLAIGWLTVPWYANVALCIAAIALACGRPGVAAFCSLLAIVLALSLCVYVDKHVRSPHAGYFVWLASMAVVFAGACARSRRRFVIPAELETELPGA